MSTSSIAVSEDLYGGRGKREHTFSTRVTSAEEADLMGAASAAGKPPSEWARDVLLNAVGGSEDSALMAEVRAIQIFLSNAMRPLLCGDPSRPRMSETQFNQLLEHVRNEKAAFSKGGA